MSVVEHLLIEWWVLFLTRSEMMSVVEHLLIEWWVLFLTRSEMMSVVEHLLVVWWMVKVVPFGEPMQLFLFQSIFHSCLWDGNKNIPC